MKQDFPLQIWECTPSYATEVQHAENRLSLLRKTLVNNGYLSHHIGRLETNRANFTARITHNERIKDYIKYEKSGKMSAKQALELSKSYGTEGHWKIGALEEYAQGEGFIIAWSMHSFGFRKAKKERDGWALRKRHEPFLYHNSNQPDKNSGECTGLESLIVKKNTCAENYVELCGSEHGIFVMPHSDSSLIEPGATQEFHITREQNGFTLDAVSISVRNETYVQVFLQSPDRRTVSVVWPSRIPNGAYQGTYMPALNHLACQLLERMAE